jgi:hypothetical protein
LAQKFGDETAMSAAQNFAGEIVSNLSEPDDARRRKKTLVFETSFQDLGNLLTTASFP